MGRTNIETEDKPTNFEMFRLTKSKVEVGISPNTLRAYNERGLKFYRQGKCVFISRSELAQFIRTAA